MKRILLIALIIVVESGCQGPYGLGPMESGISGQISFINTLRKPENIESVRVVAAVTVPPQGLGDVIFTYSSLDLSRDHIEYYLPAPKTRYEMIAVIWKKKNSAWDYKNILGFYGFDPVTYQFNYEPVTLTTKKPKATGIDIICDWSLVPNR